MDRIKLGAALLGAAAGGFAVNAFWYYRTSSFLNKRLEEDKKRNHIAFADAASVRMFANTMADIAKNSKTMSKADKEQIEALRRMVWTRVDDETALAIFDMFSDKVEEWQAEAAEDKTDPEDTVAA